MRKATLSRPMVSTTSRLKRMTSIRADPTRTLKLHHIRASRPRSSGSRRQTCHRNGSPTNAPSAAIPVIIHAT